MFQTFSFRQGENEEVKNLFKSLAIRYPVPSYEEGFTEVPFTIPMVR
jgi:hypothetical protein